MATVLVTGATDGLGRATAQALVRRGHDVVVHGRDGAKARAVADGIGAAGVLLADFARLRDVREMAARAGPVDVLVNNAGVIAPERRLTPDGIERTLQVNHLAHFLLTLALLPPRVVNVASAAQEPLDFGDLMLERGYTPLRAYARSKLAQVAFTLELAGRRSDVAVNALHPASLMDTRIVREVFGRVVSSVAEGVEATVRLVELEGVSGRYFDGLHEARAHPQVYDPAVRRRLWEASAALAGVE